MRLDVGPAFFSDDTKNKLAIFLSGYAKRILDQGFDRVFSGPLGHSLHSMTPPAKHFAEFLLNVANVVVTEQIPADSPVKKFANQVMSDIAPEIAKRIQNGKIPVDAGERVNPEEGSTSSAALSDLEGKTLQQLVEWLEGLDDLERVAVTTELKRMTRLELEKLLLVDAQFRRSLVDLLASSRHPSVGQEIKDFVGEEVRGVQRFVDGLTEKLKGR